MSISELYKAVSPISPASSTPSAPKEVKAPGQFKGPSEFEALLNQQVHLSQHAETRIRSREIPWSPALEKRIVGGIDAAQAKGSKEALILADNVAVIANVKSRTIITAMDSAQLKNRIFTNIDSAVLV